MIDLTDLQNDVTEWSRRNFGPTISWHKLLGICEEVGELCHAHLKSVQGIRGTPHEHHKAKVDAIGDLLIYLLDYCSAEQIDLEDALDITWKEVRKRDWKTNPLTGKSRSEQRRLGVQLPPEAD